MKYKTVTEGIFLRRPNRFLAEVETGGRAVTVHVKNTGRCRELLIPRCRVFLAGSDNERRKTPYDLVTVIKETDRGEILVNMDSAAPNDAVAEWLPNSGMFSPKAVIRREVTYKSSRFDFFVTDGERKAFIEVKGVTLEKDGIGYFPDAPTERGVKHLGELCECVADGYEGYVIFVIQMKGVRELRPNDVTHPQFGEALRLAAKNGVGVMAVDCKIAPDGMTVDENIAVNLEKEEEKQ